MLAAVRACRRAPGARRLLHRGPAAREAPGKWDWRELVDPKTGRLYYFNTTTRASQWDKPAGPYLPHTARESRFMTFLRSDRFSDDNTGPLKLSTKLYWAIFAGVVGGGAIQQYRAGSADKGDATVVLESGEDASGKAWG